MGLGEKLEAGLKLFKFTNLENVSEPSETLLSQVSQFRILPQCVEVRFAFVESGEGHAQAIVMQ